MGAIYRNSKCDCEHNNWTNNSSQGASQHWIILTDAFALVSANDLLRNVITEHLTRNLVLTYLGRLESLHSVENIHVKQFFRSKVRKVPSVIIDYIDLDSIVRFGCHRLGREGGGHSSCLESLYILSLYDELSAAVEGGVGEHRSMTLGNQSSSQLQTGANQKRGPPTLRRDEDPS